MRQLIEETVLPPDDEAENGGAADSDGLRQLEQRLTQRLQSLEDKLDRLLTVQPAPLIGTSGALTSSLASCENAWEQTTASSNGAISDSPMAAPVGAPDEAPDKDDDEPLFVSSFARRPPGAARTQCLLYPHSAFRQYWDAVSCALITFTALLLPYRIAFVSEWSLVWAIVEYAARSALLPAADKERSPLAI
jgi:hypothetical protein